MHGTRCKRTRNQKRVCELRQFVVTRELMLGPRYCRKARANRRKTRQASGGPAGTAIRFPRGRTVVDIHVALAVDLDIYVATAAIATTLAGFSRTRRFGRFAGAC